MKHLHYRFVNGARPGYDYGNPDEAESYFKAHGVCYSREDDSLNTYFMVWGTHRRKRVE